MTAYKKLFGFEISNCIKLETTLKIFDVCIFLLHMNICSRNSMALHQEMEIQTSNYRCNSKNFNNFIIAELSSFAKIKMHKSSTTLLSYVCMCPIFSWKYCRVSFILCKCHSFFFSFQFFALFLCVKYFFYFLCLSFSSFQFRPAIKKLINPNSYKFFHIFHMPRLVMLKATKQTHTHTHSHTCKLQEPAIVECCKYNIEYFYNVTEKNCAADLNERKRRRQFIDMDTNELCLFTRNCFFRLLSPLALSACVCVCVCVCGVFSSSSLVLLLFFVICLFCNFLSDILSFWYGKCRWIIYSFMYGWHWSDYTYAWNNSNRRKGQRGRDRREN